MKAYYFSAADKRLRYGDNRLIKTGITHKVNGDLKLCHHGLHASRRIIDAVGYALSAHLWKVELGGEIVEGEDKVCATERTYLAGCDLTKVLRQFARKAALINIEKIKPYCSADDYSLIMRWLETGDNSIRSATAPAAWLAASAARSAGNSEARHAAWSVASAARPAASSAAWSAADLAALSGSSTYSGLNDLLTSMLPKRMRID